MRNTIYLLLLFIAMSTLISCDKNNDDNDHYDDYDLEKLREEFYEDLNCKEPEYAKFLQIESVYRDQSGNTYIASRYTETANILAKYNSEGNNVWRKVFDTEHKFYDTGFGEQKENYEIIEINAVIDGALVVRFINDNHEYNKIKLFDHNGNEVRDYIMENDVSYKLFHWSNEEFIVEKINHSTNVPEYEKQNIQGTTQSYESLCTDEFYYEYTRVNEEEYLFVNFVNTSEVSFDNYFDISKFFLKQVEKEDWTEGDLQESVELHLKNILSGEVSYTTTLPLDIETGTRSRILNYDINENYFKIKFEIWYKDNTRKIVEYKVNNHTGEIATL